MAPNLIPFSTEGLTAVYDTTKRVLIVRADGDIAAFWLNPSLVRDPNFVGGLKFLFEGYPGGILPPGTNPTQHIKVHTDVYMSLPQEFFNSKTVAVETGSGTRTVIIRYTGLPPNDDGQSEISNDLASKVSNLGFSDVLPPIKEYLPGGEDHILTLSAKIPEQRPEPAISSVRLHFNPVFLEIVSSWVSNGSVFWSLKWAKFPTGNENPQLVEVETDTGIQFTPTEIGPPARISKIIQGYIVFGTLLE